MHATCLSLLKKSILILMHLSKLFDLAYKYTLITSKVLLVMNENKFSQVWPNIKVG